MNLSYVVLVAGLLIGVLNLHPARSHAAPGNDIPIVWPTEFEGHPMHPLPLSGMEASFAGSFPGAIANFQCGDRQIILRRVDQATRKLHNSATCLRAAGFHPAPGSIEIHHGTEWTVYNANRGDQTLHVREQIRSSRHPDATWTDVSRWFWHASFHPDHGPWVAITVLQENR